MAQAKQSAVAAIGMFDGVHVGHRSLIEHVARLAHERAERSVIVTFSRHPLATISPERCPAALMPLDERVEMILQAGADEVVVLDFDEQLRQLTARQFMTLIHEKYNVNALVLGFNHRFGSDRLQSLEQYRDAAQGTGLEVLRAEAYELPELDCTVSSSAVRNALQMGDIAAATAMLGRYYTLTGMVINGQHIGRQIGFPTANIEPIDSNQLIPKNGVYAVNVDVDGHTMRGMLNIGLRPTIDKSGEPHLTIEVHIIDYKGDLYGRTLQLEFLSHLRDERRFSSISDLIDQLFDDLTAAQKA